MEAQAPDMPSAEEMCRRVSKDPVAQARFFNLMLELFLQHVLGVVFLIGLQLRRAKMAVDFILTWPLMEKFIDWQAVYRDSGTVEEVEF